MDMYISIWISDISEKKYTYIVRMGVRRVPATDKIQINFSIRFGNGKIRRSE